MSKPLYIAQGLLKSWKDGEMPLNEWLDKREKDGYSPPRTPIIEYMKYNYNERYVKLCKRLGMEPVGFGAWLRKPIKDVV